MNGWLATSAGPPSHGPAETKSQNHNTYSWPLIVPYILYCLTNSIKPASMLYPTTHSLPNLPPLPRFLPPCHTPSTPLRHPEGVCLGIKHKLVRIINLDLPRSVLSHSQSAHHITPPQPHPRQYLPQPESNNYTSTPQQTKNSPGNHKTRPRPPYPHSSHSSTHCPRDTSH